jgi:hypothetical protein
MDDLLYLQHTTTFDNLIKILNSGKLYTGVDMWFNNVISEGGLTTGGWYPGSIPDQYPGVYMKLVHKNLIRQDIEYYSDVQLIFCISLLQRQDFHYNHVDSNGFINKNMTSFNIPELQDDIKKRGIIPINEVIFHHSVSLKYLKEIWVKNKRNYNILKSIFDRLSINIPIRITQKYLDITYTCDHTIDAKTPNNCYFFDKWAREFAVKIKKSGYPYDIEWYRTMAKKCGLTDIDELTPELIEDLLEQNLILSEDITNDEIKEYLRSKGVSEDNIKNLSDRQLDEIKDINLVGLNFLKNYSKLDGGKRKRKKSIRRKSVNRKYCLTTPVKKMGFSQKASCKAQGLLKRTSKKNKGKYIVSPKYKKRRSRSRRGRRSRK